jgi:adenosyl cobinamide kinase/adenosyl cobinamide phosphate guanylyltransferase
MKVRKHKEAKPRKWRTCRTKANSHSLLSQSSCLVLLLCMPWWLQFSLPET